MAKRFKWSGAEDIKLPIDKASREGTWEDHKIRQKSLREYEKKLKKIVRKLNMMKEANWELTIENPKYNDGEQNVITYKDGSLHIPINEAYGFTSKTVIYENTPLTDKDKREIKNDITNPSSKLTEHTIIMEKLLERVSTEKKKQEDINEKAKNHLREE